MTSSLDTIIAVKTKYFEYRTINTIIQWLQYVCIQSLDIHYILYVYNICSHSLLLPMQSFSASFTASSNCRCALCAPFHITQCCCWERKRRCVESICVNSHYTHPLCAVISTVSCDLLQRQPSIQVTAASHRDCTKGVTGDRLSGVARPSQHYGT